MRTTAVAQQLLSEPIVTSARPATVCEPFPVHAVPEPLQRFVREAATALGCDPVMVALPALVATASAIGTTCRIRLKSDWCEPAVLWCVVVAESGTLKSPAMELALAPVQRREDDGFSTYQNAMKRYEQDQLAYEADLRDWKTKGRRRGAKPPEKPACPTAERLVCSDTTIEALAVILQENPRGVLVARDELAGWLGSFDAYKARGRGNDAAAWLELHRMGTITVDRKSGNPRTIRVPRAAAWITGTIQPGTLRRALRPEFYENGLAARLLLARPPERTKTWTEATVSREIAVAYAGVLANLRQLQHAVDSDGRAVPVDLPLTADAHRVWVRWYNRFAERQAATHDQAMRAALSKLEATAARLALVFHCVKWAAAYPAVQLPDEIDAESVEAGIALAEWFADEAERVYAELAETEEEAEQRELLAFIRSRGGVVSARDFQSGPRRFRETAEEIRKRLDKLVQAGRGVWEHPIPGPSGGRPREVFRLLEAPEAESKPPAANPSAGVSVPLPVNPGENGV